MKKLVAISQRVDAHPVYEETRDALDQRIAAFVLACGGLPMLVPNQLGKSINDWLTRVQPTAVILSGGNDIGQYSARDATEAALLKYSEHQLLPLLGICRGMQMMADFAGTGLKEVSGHVRTTHNLRGEICGEANSFHNFSLADCPADYRVLAVSEDDQIEAISHIALPWEGWMWHPERETPFKARDLERARRLFA